MVRERERDACPGALQVHHAADGALARIRLPGGKITAAQLLALTRAACEFGSSAMELTSRGNVQIRAITAATAAVAEAVAAAGLLPSATHERVRNIVASPLSGRAGDHPDIRGWVDDLDLEIQNQPGLAALPGRFWFGIDDGRGDVSGMAADVGLQVLDDGDHHDPGDQGDRGHGVALLLAGRDTGVRLRPSHAVPTLAAVAARFVDSPETTWRVSELADCAALLDGLTVSEEPGATWPPVTRPPVGWIEQNDGRITLGAAVPLGVLAAPVAEYLATIGAPMVITPWRSVLVCDLAEHEAEAALQVLAPMGLVFDENSPWLDVSACTGSPGCAHAAANVRADAAAALHATSGVHRHFVGCERACGSPLAGEVLMATGDGYRQLRFVG